MIYLINFADNNFRDKQIRSSEIAKQIGGVDKVMQFSPQDIDIAFRNNNPETFAIKRGCGLWLWKPYLIYKQLNKLNDGDIIVYSDAGVSFKSEIKPLIETLNHSKYGMLFFELPLLDVEWTKAESFKEAEYIPNENDRQADGSFFIIKVSNKSRDIVGEWLDLCCNYKALSPEVFDTNITNHPNFQSHREDQSLLSIILHKNNIELYRDPSDYGEFPFQYKSLKYTFAPRDFDNSPYPTIILHHRGVPYDSYYKKYRKKHFLSKLGLWKEWVCDLRQILQKK